MSKALGLLPSWYWPEGVQRYLSAPRVPLYDLTVGRWVRRYGDDPALVTDAETQDFRRLDAACAAVAAACATRFPGQSPRIALAVRSPADFAALFLGLARAGATVLVLDGESDAGPSQALTEFAAQLIVSDSRVTAGGPGPREEPAALLGGATGGPPPARPSVDPAAPSVALPGKEGIAWHSHMSLMSAAMAFAAFVALRPDRRLLVGRPPGAWETLVGMLAALQVGAPALLAGSVEADEASGLVGRAAPGLVWLPASAAESLLGSSALAGAMRAAGAHLMLTTTEPFPKHTRRALRRRLGTAVLTLYGYPETGPIAAAHPSWYLDEAIGIPMTGVDLIPLNPRTGRPADLPWAALSYAGIGVRTRALAANARRRNGDGGQVDAEWYATGDLGLIDANGMLFLWGPRRP